MRSRIMANRDFFDMAKTILDEGHSVSLTVKGNSMWPFYKTGITRVILKKLDDYRKWDVVLFKKSGKYVLHRIVRIKDNTVVTRGDNNRDCETIDRDRILGRVKFYGNFHHKHDPRNILPRFRVMLWMLIRPIWLFLRSLKRKLVART